VQLRRIEIESSQLFRKRGVGLLEKRVHWDQCRAVELKFWMALRA
jgi:hypothetical protein